MRIRWIGVILIVGGILVLVLPQIIQWLVGITLIVVGVLYLLGRRT